MRHATRSPLRSLLARALGAGLLVIAASAPAAAQSCNPLEMLFGGCRAQPVAYAPAPAPIEERALIARPAPAKAVVLKKKESHAAASGGVTGKQQPLAATPAAPVGSVALFAKDPTLRAGDVVVTKNGFMVYSGRSGGFAPIARNGGALAQLEKASMQKSPANVVVEAAKADVAAVAKPASAKAENTPVEQMSTKGGLGVRKQASLVGGRSDI